MSRPTVSVILPTYDRPEFLGRAVRSVLGQSYRDLELIVVDDGSPEDPRPVVESFDDPRIRYARHERNAGNAATRNTGIRMARGRYLAFLDDDDEWAPEKLARQVPVLESSAPDEALVYCARRILRDGRVVRVDAPGKAGDIFDDILPYGLISCPSVLLKRTVLERVGLFDEGLRRGVDSDLWRRIAREYRVLYVDRVLVDCHVGHEKRISRLDSAEDLRADIQSAEAKLEKFGAELEERPAIHSLILRRLGERYIQLGEGWRGRRYLLGAVRRNPRDPLGYLYWAASLFGARGLDAALAVKEAVMKRVRRPGVAPAPRPDEADGG